MESNGTSEPIFISVVLPVLNEGRHIGGVLEALCRQKFPPDRFELLVVDGGSTDETVSVAAGLSKIHRNIRVLENPRRLSSSGRNVGARAARGDAVLFVDGHCEIPDEFLLRNLADLFRTTSADVICRPQPLEWTGSGDVQRAIVIARTSWLGHNPSSLIFSTAKEDLVDPDSSGAAYTRRVFERIGYYDERLDACEDVDFNLRARKAGLRAFTSPRVMVRYHARDDLGPLFRQMARYGAGRARLFLKHPRDATSGPILLGTPLVIVVALAVLALFFMAAGQALFFLACAYVLLIASASLVLSLRHGLRLMPSIFVALLITHAGLFAGFWRGMIGFGRPARSPAER
ncbi:MAG: glycosyltransferase family 2 protein [Candidatus Eisenbacteria bacterium]|nr:glycosyltransferase family 2 protein [Candidatus Eisenbacteria bacterium]